MSSGVESERLGCRRWKGSHRSGCWGVERAEALERRGSWLTNEGRAQALGT